MKKILTLLMLLSFNSFAAWTMYDTDEGGIGIYQNMANGKKNNQISIYGENGKYNFLFITSENVLTYEIFGLYKADFELINDKNQSYSFMGSQVSANSFVIKKLEGLLKYLKESEWIILEFYLAETAANKKIKFNVSGLEKSLKNVKE